MGGAGTSPLFVFDVCGFFLFAFVTGFILFVVFGVRVRCLMGDLFVSQIVTSFFVMGDCFGFDSQA